MGTPSANETGLSLYRAMPLSEEPGLGALSLPGYLRDVCDRYGDAEAVVMHSGDTAIRWSYRDLWQQSLSVAQALTARGVGKGSRVGILMTNRPEYLSSLFGIAMTGATFVVLSTFSTPSELEHALNTSGVSVLLYEDRVLKKDFSAQLVELAPTLSVDGGSKGGGSESGEFYSPQLPYLRELVWLEGVTALEAPAVAADTLSAATHWDDFIAAGAAVPEAVIEARMATVYPSDPGGLFFSSGTTSLPKAILQTQRAFTLQFWRWPRLWNLQEPARCWTGNGFFWAGPLTIIVGSALSSGGALILQPLFDEHEALELIKREKVTLMNGRPHQWARMQASPGWDSADFSTVRYITKGEIIHSHPTSNSDWELPNAFGTTETMSILSSFVAGDPANADAANFGKLLPGNTLKVVDPVSGEIVPMGERGEVCIKGPTLMMGYVGKNAEDTFDEQGFYRTGDGGYIDEQGHLFWEGRLNDIIKTGGANVSPQEIDTAIAAFPGVKRTQTVGLPHDTLSEVVVACIVPVDGADIDVDELTAFLKSRLASFKVPRHILLFSEEDYPLTGNEKVKAGELKTLAAQRLA